MGRLSPAARLGDMLRERSLSLAVAESVTGGLVCHLITEVPGASEYLRVGVVSYSVWSKEEILRVDRSLVTAEGVVSGAVARAMADGVRRLGGTDLGLGLTGLAGPGGAEPGKPVGLVFIGVSGPGGTVAERFLFVGDRSAVKRKAARAAITFLIGYLNGFANAKGR